MTVAIKKQRTFQSVEVTYTVVWETPNFKMVYLAKDGDHAAQLKTALEEAQILDCITRRN